MNKAAKILKVKESSAKYIVRIFKRKGKVLMKNKEIDKKVYEEFKQLQSKFNFTSICNRRKKR